MDNAAYSYVFQKENGVPIIPYYQGKDDYELKALEGYLKSLVKERDMRTVNRKIFKLERYVEYSSHVELVRDLYLD